MAFGSELLFNGQGPMGYDANYHKVYITCVNVGVDSYLVINKLWIDSYNAWLDDYNQETINSAWPEFRFFPFFISGPHSLTGGEELPFTVQNPDSFDYPAYFNVLNGSVTHPLSNWSATYGGFTFNGFNTPGFGGNIKRRDNYRLPKRFKLHDNALTGDQLAFKLMFSTDLKGNHKGYMNIEYFTYNAGNGDIEYKSRAVPLNGVIHRSNFSEVDYTNFEDIYEMEDAVISNPFISVELS